MLPTKEHLERWITKTAECSEFGTLTLGPFEDGIKVEFIDAWYGIRGDLQRQVEATEYVSTHYSPKDGLKLSSFNSIFGDPAPMRLKRMCVEYRLTNLKAKPHDVSRAKYSEGTIGHLGLVPVIVAKSLGNVLGATLAASGLYAGRMHVAVKNAVSEGKCDVADSEIFQAGFSTWLTLNGIWPSVVYEPLPDGGRAEDMKLTPLIVSNHMCYLDGPVLAAIFGAPKIIAMKGTLNTPLLGSMAQEIGVLEVDRGDRDSRKLTLQAISSHVDSWKVGSRPLLLFPEGTTSNGDSLLPFKKGAFSPGVPVRPVVMTYTGSWHPANVNFKTNSVGEVVSTGDAEWCGEFLGHMFHSLVVKVLPPYTPNAEEKANPELYAANVRQTMSEAYLKLKSDGEARQQEEGLWQVAAKGVATVTSPFKKALDLVGGLLPTSETRGADQQEAASFSNDGSSQHRGSRFKRRDTKPAACYSPYTPTAEVRSSLEPARLRPLSP